MSERKPTPRKNPEAIAAAAAAEYFAAIATHSDLGDAFREMDSPIDHALDEIGRLLKAEHVKTHGPIELNEDAPIAYELIGRETGYLIGVQVGMRLRGGAQ